jgi:hypothetical protein
MERITRELCQYLQAFLFAIAGGGLVFLAGVGLIVDMLTAKNVYFRERETVKMVQMVRTMQTYNGDLIHFTRTLSGWMATFDLGFDLEPRVVHFRRPRDGSKVWTAWLRFAQEPVAIGKTLQEVFGKVAVQNTGKRTKRFFELLERDRWDPERIGDTNG